MDFSMEKPYPLSAVLFAKIFESMEAALAMQGLLNAVIQNSGDAPLAEIRELRSEAAVMGDAAYLKSTRLDALAKTVTGEIICVEVQLAEPGIYDMVDRSLFYGAGQIQSALNAGEGYEKIPRVVLVNLLGYERPETDEHYHQPVKFMYCRGNRPASEKLVMHNIELPKFQRVKTIDKSNLLEVWLYTMTEGIKNPEWIKEAIGMDASLDQFMKRYNLATRDESTMSKYRIWLKTVNDEATIRQHMEKIELRASQADVLEQELSQVNRRLSQKSAADLMAALRCGFPLANAHTLGRQMGLPDDEIGRIQKEFESQ